MKQEILDKAKLAYLLAIPDLTDPANSTHAINLILEKMIETLNSRQDWPKCKVFRHDPITTVANNYDRLLFPEDNIGRSSTYTRYVSETEVLRTHSSAIVPKVLAIS